MRLICIIMASIMPTNALRVFFLRRCGYVVHEKCRIGLLNYIDVSRLELKERVRIGRFNILKGPFSMSVGAETEIGSRNRFICGAWTLEERYAAVDFKRSIRIGESCTITSGHFFDVTDAITVGDQARIAGIRSEFWTHGLSRPDRAVAIGEKCYIGSSSAFAPGASVGNFNVVAMRSVVVTKIDAEYSLIAGHPATVVKSIRDEIESGQRYTFGDT